MVHNIAVYTVVAVSLVILQVNISAAQTGDISRPPPPSVETRPAPLAGDSNLLGAPSVTVGRSIPTADGVGTKTVPAKPCTTFARETDGTTTCIGVPAR
jgi:hypothetical protein